MMLNAYGSAVLRSEMDFPIWASVKHGVENPVKRGTESEREGETKKYDELVAKGYTVRVSPFTHSFGDEPPMKMYNYIKRTGGPEAEEEYKVMQFLYQYIYIANTIGIEYCDKWMKHLEGDTYRQEQYERAVKNKPKLAYCHLKSSGGQCRIDCPFWNGGCRMSDAEEQASAALIEKYEPLKRREERWKR